MFDRHSQSRVGVFQVDTKRIYLVFLLSLSTLLMLSGSSLAGDCEEAVTLYNQATVAKDLSLKEELFTRALTLPCQDRHIIAKIHNNLADTYEQQGRIDEAIEKYKKACKVDPFLPTPYLGLGDIYTKLKRLKEAERFYEKGFLIQNYRPSREIVKFLSPSRSIRVKPRINLYFAFDQVSLGKEAGRQLGALLAALEDPELQPYRFRLAGHTCNVGTEKYNRTLSVKRAMTVKEWLFAHGFLEDRLITLGFGEDRPIARNDTEEDRRRNRRVEISTVGVADIGVTRGIHGSAQLMALKLLRDGERSLAEERYAEAVEFMNKALLSFEKEKFNEGIKAALEDLSIAYRFLGDWEKAENYSKRWQKAEK